MSGTDDIDPSASAAGAGAVDGSGESAEVAPTEATSADVAIAEALAAGRIDPATARELLLNEVLAEQLKGASPETVERIAAEVRGLLEDDPTLERLLAPRGASER